MTEPKQLRLIRNSSDMTVEEFADELARIRQKAWYIKTVVGTRQDRAYKNQKRGDFFGKDKENGQTNKTS